MDLIGLKKRGDNFLVILSASSLKNGEVNSRHGKERGEERHLERERKRKSFSHPDLSRRKGGGWGGGGGGGCCGEKHDRRLSSLLRRVNLFISWLTLHPPAARGPCCRSRKRKGGRIEAYGNGGKRVATSTAARSTRNLTPIRGRGVRPYLLAYLSEVSFRLRDLHSRGLFARNLLPEALLGGRCRKFPSSNERGGSLLVRGIEGTSCFSIDARECAFSFSLISLLKKKRKKAHFFFRGSLVAELLVPQRGRTPFTRQETRPCGPTRLGPCSALEKKGKENITPPSERVGGSLVRSPR